jgi:hypothetical protein
MINKKAIFSIFISTIITNQIFAEIIQTSSTIPIEFGLSSSNKKGVLLMLIEDVILEAEDPILRRNNQKTLNSIIKKALKKILMEEKIDFLRGKKRVKEAKAKIDAEKTMIMQDIDFKNVLKAAKKAGFKVLIFSLARDKNTQDNILKQVKNNKIEIEGWEEVSKKYFKLRQSVARFESGVIFLPASKIKEHLSDFFQVLSDEYKKIVIVDTSQKRLIDFDAFFRLKEIECSCFEYTKAKIKQPDIISKEAKNIFLNKLIKSPSDNNSNNNKN